ncbi:hypothetical protein BGZ95_003640 [Linnemannia exigua]|uniref:Uncharacterized protein n=1 Tax=Linnemannia exigua TaxID=604196 RepID=A0AAD4D4H0_9FUNG|nr:hypothetical protein BGZ95_003640 [Linnemannia exigua]
MPTTRLLKIPELVSLIGQHLDRNDFTICIRVNKPWFDAFCPMLYHTIVVADFDIYTHASGAAFTALTGTTYTATTITAVAHQAASQPPAEDSSTPLPLSISIDEKERVKKDIGYGGSRIHKYSRLIRSITVANIHSLTYLGEEAVNLTHIAVRSDLTTNIHFKPAFQDSVERRSWNGFWDQYRKGEVIIPIWVSLIERNPDLQSVHIDLNYCDPGTEKIIHALSQAKQLEVVSLWGMTQIDTIKLLLDQCPHIRSLKTSSGYRAQASLSGPDQIFKLDDVGTPTKIRSLNIRTSESWPIHVLRRCPDLEVLTITVFATSDAFVTLVQEVTQLALAKFFVLRGLTFVVRSRDYTTNAPIPIGDRKDIITNLLNSCCAQLTSLTITDSLRILVPIMDQLDPILWSRLEEFRYTHGGSRPSRLAQPTSRLCDLLALCPNLRVFEVSYTPVTAPELLKVHPICLHSLVSLKLIVSADHFHTRPLSGNPQYPHAAPPAWLPAPISQEEAQMATMGQFELPPNLPQAPVPMHSAMSSTNAISKMVTDQAKEVNQKIVKFTQLRSLQFGSKIESSDIMYIPFPPLKGLDECVRTFKEGLPRLVSLQVKDVSYD